MMIFVETYVLGIFYYGY
uniref:Uncharacterized protein n=1 Tax=Arundo donax TaxID=35708 RepID=A0A0A9CD05_ARUDO